MSNFICSECGLTNIDCVSAGYKTTKEIELEKKLEIATKALERYSTTDTHDWIDSQVVAKKALKEMEGVK